MSIGFDTSTTQTPQTSAPAASITTESVLTDSGATLLIPTDPQSPYVIALRRNLVNGTACSDAEKESAIMDTIISSLPSGGAYQTWYTTASAKDSKSGYEIAFRYADGLPFVASAFSSGEKTDFLFYFWGDQLLCCGDYRGGKTGMSFAGSEVYDRITKEFGDLYALSEAAVGITPSSGKPGPHDLVGQEGVAGPTSGWLAEYKTQQVKGTTSGNAYLRWSPSQEGREYNRYVSEGETVRVLAEENGFSLVLSSDGRAGWVTSKLLK